MTVRALHLASFDGNIGDNLNHFGFYKALRENSDPQVEFTPLEIREFYWKLRTFDESFVEQVNSYDLLVVGGGNYFELWVGDSPTGTSFALPLEHLKNIRVPIWFNALGVDVGQGASEDSIKKFRSFLESCIQRQDLISVRNDGAMKALSGLFGNEILDFVRHAPDGGFYSAREDCIEPAQKFVLALNLASDMPDVRFPGGNRINYEMAVSEFARTIEGICKLSEGDVVLIPHIFRDLNIISDVLSQLSDPIRRRRVAVGHLHHGVDSFRIPLGLYGRSDLVLANRFHANIMGMAMERPTVGLFNYRQIFDLHEEVGSTALVDVREMGFADRLVTLFESLQGTGSAPGVSVKRSADLRNAYRNYIKNASQWLREKVGT